MAKVLLVSYDVQTVSGRGGGVGAFLTHFGLALRGAGEAVTILLIRAENEACRVDENWRAFYREYGIALMEVTIARNPKGRRPDFWGMRMSETVEPLLGAFDAVYFADWGNPALLPARRKRFASSKTGPVLVTVLHGPSEWVLLGDRRYPAIPAEVQLDYMERYGAEFSDFVASPSQYMADRLRQSGWRFPNLAVLGLPMSGEFAPRDGAPVERLERIVYFGRLERRKGFDLFVEALRIAAASEPKLLEGREVVLLGGDDRYSPGAGAQVVRELTALGFGVRHVADRDSRQANEFLRQDARRTLCVVPSRGDNFPYALIEASLIPGLNVITCRVGGIPEMFAGPFERQLSEATPAAIAELIIARLREPIPAEDLFRYDVDGANRRWIEFHQRVVRHERENPPAGDRSEFVLVADPKVKLASNAIERLTEAIAISGADCLACGGHEGPHKERAHMPMGPDLTSALVDPDVLGRSVLMVRRSALKAVNAEGFLTHWEIQVRMVLQGFSVDVLPEYLYWREELDGAGRDEELRLMAAACDRAVGAVGLHGLASTLMAAQLRTREIQNRAGLLEKQIQFAERRMGYFDGPWLHGIRIDDPSPWPVRFARRLYRSWVAPETRRAIERRYRSWFKVS